MNENWSVLKLAVSLLGAVTILSVVATTVLLANGDAAPEGVIAIGAGGVGALATLLTNGAAGMLSPKVGESVTVTSRPASPVAQEPLVEKTTTTTTVTTPAPPPPDGPPIP